MKLTAKESRAILQGEHPRLERPYVEGEPCPFKPGEVEPIKTLQSEAGPIPYVAITITAVRRGKKGEWRAAYAIQDDRALYVATQPGYTHLPELSIDPEASVDDPDTLSRFETEGRLSRLQQREDRQTAKEVRRKRERAIRDRLRETLSGLEPLAQTELLASIEQTIESTKQAGIASELKEAA